MRFDQTSTPAYYDIDSVEGAWNTGREEGGPNLGYKPRYKEGYFPVPPTDHYQDLRTEMALTLDAAGIPVEVQHHEVATAGQAEIDIRFGTLVRDGRQRMMLYKYIVKNMALQARQDRHLHAQAALPGQRLGHAHPPGLWKNGEPLFYDE